MKIVIIGIAILAIGALFVLQDFGGELAPESEQPVIKRATDVGESECDPSYPDFCIDSNSPDLDCDEIRYSNFRVLQPDPHGFDRDRDGIGCETTRTQTAPSQQTTQQSTQPSQPAPTRNCDPSYPDVCIPPYPPDLDCGEISEKRFRVLQPDPHRFDGDKDGIGCE